jgi:exosome complex component RRP4
MWRQKYWKTSEGDLMEKKLVVPGELVTDQRKRLGNHVYLREGKIFSDCVGLVSASNDVASVVPLEGKYLPQENDLVIGIITAEKFSGYLVEINSLYPAFVSKKELREILKPGTIISTKVIRVNELNEVDLSNVRAFFGGELVQISPVKVPRLIGKEGSMLNVLKNGTKSSVLVGKNGWVWVKGGNPELFAEAVNLIEQEAHKENLTNKVIEFLQKKNESKEKIVSKEKAQEEEKVEKVK